MGEPLPAGEWFHRMHRRAATGRVVRLGTMAFDTQYATAQTAPGTQHSPDCVFCHRRGQPEILFASERLYAVPDKFPLLPGHALVITRQHARCLAELDADGERELEEAADRVRAFLGHAYGAP